jgi:hypothetical protein
VSYSSGIIQATALQGVNKLQPGQSLVISFTATPATCAGTDTFSTSAFGGTSSPFTDKFNIGGSQPTVQVTGCQLSPGGSITGPGGTTVTAGNDWTGTVDVSFQGTLACPDNAQWAAGYHLPDVVTIDPSGVTSDTVKSFTFTFTGTADSSFYVICYSPNSTDTTGTILDPCYSGTGDVLTTAPPCVAKQYKVFNTNTVSIKIRVPSGDPRAH